MEVPQLSNQLVGWALPTNKMKLSFVQWWAVPTLLGARTLTFVPSMQPSIAAFIGLSKNLFERSEFIFAPMKARSAGKSRSDLIVGWPFLWFRFFWPLTKEMNTQLPLENNKIN